MRKQVLLVINPIWIFFLIDGLVPAFLKATASKSVNTIKGVYPQFLKSWRCHTVNYHKIGSLPKLAWRSDYPWCITTYCIYIKEWICCPEYIQAPEYIQCEILAWKVVAAAAPAHAISILATKVSDTWQVHSRMTTLGKFIFPLHMNNKEKGLFSVWQKWATGVVGTVVQFKRVSVFNSVK